MNDYNYPVCPVCGQQQVYVMGDEITGDDWLEMFECDGCGWQGDDPDYPIDGDETPEQVDAYLRANGYDPAALVKRMQQRFKLTMLESPLNPEKFYFRQEWVNALYEMDDDEPEIRVDKS